MVEIKGLETFAPKDFPGHISSSVFLGGCNFRCPYCHNARLVLDPGSLPSFPLNYFLSYLDSRKDWLEAVCITGGEPLLNEDLEAFIVVIKDRGLRVKLDTNGSFPRHLMTLVEKKLLDSVAMDIKAPLERYRKVTGSEVNVRDIEESIAFIRDSGVDSIFRTTVVPGLVGPEDMEKICLMARGAKTFQIQQFSPGETLDPGLAKQAPYPADEIRAMARAAEPYFASVLVEGV